MLVDHDHGQPSRSTDEGARETVVVWSVYGETVTEGNICTVLLETQATISQSTTSELTSILHTANTTSYTRVHDPFFKTCKCRCEL